MTNKEIVIINELRKNSRRSLTDISKDTDTPLSSVFKTVTRLEKTVVRKHTCIVDFAQLGYPLKVGMFITTGKKKELKKLRTSPASNRAVKKSIFMSKLLFQGRNRGGVLKIVPNGPFG